MRKRSLTLVTLHHEAPCRQHSAQDGRSKRRSSRNLANKLLHSKPPIYLDDADCARLSASFNQYFVDKINRIRDNIAAALQSMSGRRSVARHHVGNKMSTFRPTTAKEVSRVLSMISSKSSPLDVLPIGLLKSCKDIFAQVIVRLANLSFTERRFPLCYKNAQVTPLLKKSVLDSSNPANYRPISNLTTISEVLKRLVLIQLRPHQLNSANFSE
jgi:hypothetical protein